MLYHRQCAISSTIEPLQEALFKTIADPKYTCAQVQFLLRVLEESKNDLCVLDRAGNSYVLAALSRQNNEEMASFLYHFFKQKKLDAGIWTVPSCQRSALWFAARHGYTKIVKSMLDDYPHPDLFIVKELIPDSVTPLELIDERAVAPLAAAAEHGHVEIVKLLLSAIKKVNLETIIDRSDKVGYSALARACKNGHVGVVNELLLSGASVNVYTNYRESPLLLAVENQHKAVVNLLLTKNLSDDLLNAANRVGFTALYYAIVKGEEELIANLLLAGASFAAEKQDLSILTKLPKEKSVEVLDYLNVRGVFIGRRLPQLLVKMASPDMLWLTWLNARPIFVDTTLEQKNHIKVHVKRALLSAKVVDSVLEKNILSFVAAKFGLKELMEFTLNQTHYLAKVKLPSGLNEIISDKNKQRLAIVHADEVEEESFIQTVGYLNAMPALQQKILAHIEKLLTPENKEDEYIVEMEDSVDIKLSGNRIDIIGLIDAIDNLRKELMRCYDDETWQHKGRTLFCWLIGIFSLVSVVLSLVATGLSTHDGPLSPLFVFLKCLPAVVIGIGAILFFIYIERVVGFLKRHQLWFDTKLEWPLRCLTEQQSEEYQHAITGLQALQQALVQDYPALARQLNHILAEADINIGAASKKLNAAKHLLEQVMPEINSQGKAIQWRLFKPAVVPCVEIEEEGLHAGLLV